MKQTYIIWKEEDDRNIANYKEVVGIFTGTYEEADQLIEKMNAGDDSVSKGIFGNVMYGYSRTEPATITLKNYSEFLPH